MRARLEDGHAAVRDGRDPREEEEPAEEVRPDDEQDAGRAGVWYAGEHLFAFGVFAVLVSWPFIRCRVPRCLSLLLYMCSCQMGETRVM